MLAVAVALLTFPAAEGSAQARIEEYRSQFERESDPVRKARLMPRYGEAQLDLLRELVGRGEFDAALGRLREYRDAVAAAHKALKSSGINAEKKPAGFKQLQIHLRRSLHRLEDIIVAVPFEQRPAFETIRKELDDVDRELLSLLFPRKPGPSKETKGKN